MFFSIWTGIVSFFDKYNPLDGINAPKRIKCRGTDGVWRPQLVKGRDDMRQDAVMEQVFTIMNGLLASDKQTKRLLIRTYKVNCKIFYTFEKMHFYYAIHRHN